MSDRADDFDRGVVNRRSVLGDAWVDKSLTGATAFNADFQSLITRYAWHEIWGRPGLDHETRRLLVLGMTMGLARWEEFELHCRAAIEHGVALEKIKETLMQGAIYCGVPAANTAFKITTDLLRTAGKLSAQQSLAAPVRVASHHTFSAPQIHVTVQGEGPPVVLSHALGLDVHMWDELAARLAKNMTVLRYEHRGHGGSAVPPGPYTIEQLVDDAARVIREWGRGPVAWIGLSMGGMVGQGLAILHPELLQRRGARQHHRALSGSRRGDLGGAHRRGRAGRHGGGRRRRRRALPRPGLPRRASGRDRGAEGQAAALRSGRLRRLLPRHRQGRLARPAGRGAHADARHRRRQGRWARRRRWRGRSPSASPAPAGACSTRRRTSASPSCRTASMTPWRLFSHRSKCPFPPSGTRS